MGVDLYLHIGTEKTGTTSIQRFLKANRELLADKGILYPVAPGKVNHMGLTVAALDDQKGGPLRQMHGVRDAAAVKAYRETLVREIEAELKERPYTVAIMSNEHCSSRLVRDSEVERLRDLLSPLFRKIFIVVYIRRQDAYLLSSYSTKVKSGQTRELAVPSKGVNPRYDHWEFLSRWANVFGREQILCRRFERGSLLNGDVVVDFLETVHIPQDLPYTQPESANESLDINTLEFLRLFNKHVPRFVEDEVNRSRDNLVPLLNTISNGPLPTASEEDLKRFMALFAETNRKVALEYFGAEVTNSDDPLFLPRADNRDRTRAPSLTVERAVEIAAFLWQEKQKEVDALSGRVKRLGERLHGGGAPAGGRAQRRRQRRGDDDEAAKESELAESSGQ